MRPKFNYPLQFINSLRLSFAILGPQGPFRDDSFTRFFNPTKTEPPFFQISDQDFLSILGPSPSFHEVASNATFAFAHEAPIYVSETDEVFFASNMILIPEVHLVLFGKSV